MTDYETAATWEQLESAWRVARAASQLEWAIKMHPAVCEGLRIETIRQIGFTVILARLVERFGQMAGWRIWHRWLARKVGS